MITVYGIDLDDAIPRGWGCAGCGVSFGGMTGRHECRIRHDDGKPAAALDVCTNCRIRLAVAQRKELQEKKDGRTDAG